MNAAEYYANQITNGWTRIDMLLALYEAAVDALSSAEEAQACGDTARVARQMLQAQRLVVGILAGINPDCHDLAGQIERLCHFLLDRIGRRDFGAARRILAILKEAFESIAEEARELERTGIARWPEDHPAVNVTA